MSGDNGVEYNIGNDCSIDVIFDRVGDKDLIKKAYLKSSFQSYVRPILLDISGEYGISKDKKGKDYRYYNVLSIYSADERISKPAANKAFKKAHGMNFPI